MGNYSLINARNISNYDINWTIFIKTNGTTGKNKDIWLSNSVSLANMVILNLNPTFNPNFARGSLCLEIEKLPLASVKPVTK